jgi:hypothetical protein
MKCTSMNYLNDFIGLKREGSSPSPWRCESKNLQVDAVKATAAAAAEVRANTGDAASFVARG